MTFLGQDKPSLEDVIEHHGVKGMHWGRRKGKVSTDEIKDARYRVHTQASKLQAQKHKVRMAKGKEATDKELKKYNTQKASFLKNPDRATAARMSKGEKVVVGVAAVTVIGLPYAAGYVGARVVGRKVIERNVRNNTQNA